MISLRKYGRACAASLAAAGVLASITTAATTANGASRAPSAAPAKLASKVITGCDLGHGVKHVIEITFDNVHFFRDNPNVPSDLELMPHLLDFIESQGTMLSNNHTPLIAHTTDDSLTTYTGLYGDRAGMPISNSYRSYNGDGTSDLDGSFAYWTDPAFDETNPPNPQDDANPSMVYSPTPPATTSGGVTPNTVAPAPWVPWTWAGCNVGDVSTANMVLENAKYDIPKVFGPGSPEAQQLNADSDFYKDPETADYVGLAVHCAAGAALCANAEAVKYGQTSPSATAVADVLTDEPGGYTGYQALFGHRYIAPEIGGGSANVTHHGYAVTNSSGNLVDLNGNEIDGAFLNDHPGFPGFSNINASQTLAYMADMQEAGVPVTYGYIADLHGNEFIPGLAACDGAPEALPSGNPCYIAQAQYYDQAFETFFKRLAADGITPANSLFVFSSDEGDHEAGANVGRSLQPTPANCDGAVVSGLVVTPDVACTYPSGTFGELDVDFNGLLAKEHTSDTTPFSIENDTAPEVYVNGQPGPDVPAVRQLERDVATLTVKDPYAGTNSQLLANYLADPTEEAILHMVNADPLRTPTFALFAKPDYYVQSGNCGSSGCVFVNDGFAWDHGDYAPEIDSNYVGMVGPGVANLGLDGWTSLQGPSSAGADSGQGTIPGEDNPGTWTDETDIQPTVLYLAGLADDYTPDGRVISQVLAHPAATLAPSYVADLGEAYKQVNSSVGKFGTYTLEAATKAIASKSSNDSNYTQTDAALSALENARDYYLANEIKNQLEGAEFGHVAISQSTANSEIAFANYLDSAAQSLAANTSAASAAGVASHLAGTLRSFKAAT